MKNKEKFPYDLDMGAVMDFVEDHFMLVIKDEVWTEEELTMLKQPLSLNFCYTNDIAVFVLEGGDIDSSDFYFNVQDCDFAQTLMESSSVDVELVLLNEANEICFRRRKSLDKEQTKRILDCLSLQQKVQFMPNEYDVNVEGLQSAYEPFELLKFSKLTVEL